mmetsp:Transcript_1920/g.5744  ORF Transcript_1920/g.5744 Transcript_1920/m.5744 type:complete len:215 (+) Transcript_1920:1048-1692(+)
MAHGNQREHLLRLVVQECVRALLGELGTEVDEVRSQHLVPVHAQVLARRAVHLLRRHVRHELVQLSQHRRNVQTFLGILVQKEEEPSEVRAAVHSELRPLHCRRQTDGLKQLGEAALLLLQLPHSARVGGPHVCHVARDAAAHEQGPAQQADQTRRFLLRCLLRLLLLRTARFGAGASATLVSALARWLRPASGALRLLRHLLLRATRSGLAGL